MSVREQKSTDTQRVYRALRTELLNGSFTPGSKLRMTAFAKRYQVSLSVVREAMIRLAGEGLAESLPQRGFCMAPLSSIDLLDLTRSRVLIETITLRESIQQGDHFWESAVIAAHHALQRTPYIEGQVHFHDAWSQAHFAFHRALLGGAGNPRLESLAEKLRDCSLLYGHWSLVNASVAHRDFVAEDGTIAKLAIARDSAGAVKALKEHLERSTEALLANREGNHTRTEVL